MIMTVAHSSLQGKLRVIPAKAASHRALLMAALSKGVCEIEPLQFSRDIEVTLDAVQRMGWAKVLEQRVIDADNALVHIKLEGGLTPERSALRTLDCGESGSTLRFLMPLALDGLGTVRFVGHGRLMERPLTVYRELFMPRFISWIDEAGALTLDGKLAGDMFSFRGDISSQFVTGLLLALPRLESDSTLHITTPLESRAYVELTRSMQARFGVKSTWVDAQTLAVPGAQQLVSPSKVSVEGDWSHAAFYLAAGVMGEGTVTLGGLDAASVQSDRAIVSILRDMGGRVDTHADGSISAHASGLHGIQIDASQIPDIVPILAVLGCAAEGTTTITGAARLRIKECDRLAAMAQELTRLGAAVTELEDGLIIRGGRTLCGTKVHGHNDHRIVMSLAVASAITAGELHIDDAQSVTKSAPRFFDEFRSLGGHAYES